MSTRKLQQWREAGLIDADTVRRIDEYESTHAKPLGLWAIIGIGALAIGLGLISLVAANWDAIDGMTRLTLHFALIVIGFAAYFWQMRRTTGDGDDGDKMSQRFFSDAGLFIMAALTLTFFGHIGQVYQTSSPLWQPLLLWLILFTPALLLLGRGWLAALAWAAALAGTTIDFSTWYVDQIGDMPVFLAAALTAIAPAVVALGAWMRGRTSRDLFWIRVEQVAMIALAFIVAGFHLAAEVSGDRSGRISYNFLATAGVQTLLFGLLACAIFMIPRRERNPKSQKAVAIIIIAAAISNLLAAKNGGYSDVIAAMCFMAFWAVVAWAALWANWRLIFQLSVAILAVRLIVLSFQLGIDLLGSGIGLILAGVLTLAIAWGAVRFTREYAPDRQPDDDSEGEAA